MCALEVFAGLVSREQLLLSELGLLELGPVPAQGLVLESPASWWPPDQKVGGATVRQLRQKEFAKSLILPSRCAEQSLVEG